MINNIEVIAMVYKSPDYARFIANQLHNTRLSTTQRHCPVSVTMVANDPVFELESQLDQISRDSKVKYDVYYDLKPQDYYLNRVYRCWNYCVRRSYCEWVCLVNSDMMFEVDWLHKLLARADNHLPTSRLVESGKLLSGRWAISHNFGRHPNSLDIDGWHKFSAQLKVASANEVGAGGLFMPCIFNRTKFLELGGYPEGNIYNDGIGTRNGPVIQSGDAWFFDKYSSTYNMPHITVMDSLVYHIQEGEMDE